MVSHRSRILATLGLFLVAVGLGCSRTEATSPLDEAKQMLFNDKFEQARARCDEILAANPDMPDLQFLIPLENSYDPGFEEFMAGPKKTPDYIPEGALACATKEFRNKPREITLRLGDTVDILAERPGNTNFPIFLVRTQHDTYAWIVAYHLKCRDGKRMGALD